MTYLSATMYSPGWAPEIFCFLGPLLGTLLIYGKNCNSSNNAANSRQYFRIENFSICMALICSGEESSSYL